MKKSLLLGLACTLMLGVSGCMEENKVNNVSNEVDIDNNQLVEAMLNKINKNYNENFKAYKFFPSKKGFITFESYSYLLAENDKDLQIIIFEKNGSKGVYVDNYNDVLLANSLEKYFNNAIDFEGEVLISITSTELMGKSKEEIESNPLDLLKNEDTVEVFVAVEKFDEETIIDLYELYNKLYNYNNMFSFQVAETKNLSKTKEFVDYYVYYSLNDSWSSFDESAELKMYLYRENITSIEEFKSFVEEVK